MADEANTTDWLNPDLRDRLGHWSAHGVQPGEVLLLDVRDKLDRLQDALLDVIGMVEGCLDAPTNPDSLVQMVAARAREALR